MYPNEAVQDVLPGQLIIPMYAVIDAPGPKPTHGEVIQSSVMALFSRLAQDPVVRDVVWASVMNLGSSLEVAKPLSPLGPVKGLTVAGGSQPTPLSAMWRDFHKVLNTDLDHIHTVKARAYPPIVVVMTTRQHSDSHHQARSEFETLLGSSTTPLHPRVIACGFEIDNTDALAHLAYPVEGERPGTWVNFTQPDVATTVS